MRIAGWGITRYFAFSSLYVKVLFFLYQSALVLTIMTVVDQAHYHLLLRMSYQTTFTNRNESQAWNGCFPIPLGYATSPYLESSILMHDNLAATGSLLHTHHTDNISCTSPHSFRQDRASSAYRHRLGG